MEAPWVAVGRALSPLKLCRDMATLFKLTGGRHKSRVLSFRALSLWHGRSRLDSDILERWRFSSFLRLGEMISSRFESFRLHLFWKGWSQTVISRNLLPAKRKTIANDISCNPWIIANPVLALLVPCWLRRKGLRLVSFVVLMLHTGLSNNSCLSFSWHQCLFSPECRVRR